jgi:hypothetical protein
MKEIILQVLTDVACSNTGSCQINMQSESAREMIADKLVDSLEPYINNKIGRMVEQVVCGCVVDEDE